MRSPACGAPAIALVNKLLLYSVNNLAWAQVISYRVFLTVALLISEKIGGNWLKYTAHTGEFPLKNYPPLMSVSTFESLWELRET